MNNPNPLSPLTPLSQAARGRSNVRIAVISIIALHAVFFGGLLMQGCGPKSPENRADAGYGTSASAATNDLGSLAGNPYGNPTNFLGGGPTSTNGYDSFGSMSNVAPPYTPPPAGGYLQPGTPDMTPPPLTVQETPQPGAGGTSEYEVKRNDTLDKIAKAHGISVQALKNANPGIDARKLQVKQKLNLPASPKKVAAAPGAAPGAVADSLSLYVVKSGETLYAIAKAHGLTVAALRKANNLKTDTIHVNQKLKLPAGGQLKASSAPSATPAATSTAPAAAPTNAPLGR